MYSYIKKTCTRDTGHFELLEFHFSKYCSNASKWNEGSITWKMIHWLIVHGDPENILLKAKELYFIALTFSFFQLNGLIPAKFATGHTKTRQKSIKYNFHNFRVFYILASYRILGNSFIHIRTSNFLIWYTKPKYSILKVERWRLLWKNICIL